MVGVIKGNSAPRVFNNIVLEGSEEGTEEIVPWCVWGTGSLFDHVLVLSSDLAAMWG